MSTHALSLSRDHLVKRVLGLALVLGGAVATIDHAAPAGSWILRLGFPPRCVAEAAIEHTRQPAERDRWIAVHVLDDEDARSRRVLDHLLGPTRPRGVVEVILWVGAASPRIALAEARGLRVQRVTARQVAVDYPGHALPLLVIADRGGSLRYIGGSTRRTHDEELADFQLISDLVTFREERPRSPFVSAFNWPLSRRCDDQPGLP